MKRVIFSFIILTLVQIACGVPQDCMGITASITGFVVDDSEIPIADASVTIYGNPADTISFPETLTVQTNADGEFIVDGVFTYECADFYIDVSADGFEHISGRGPSPIWMTFGEFEQDIVITLTRS